MIIPMFLLIEQPMIVKPLDRAALDACMLSYAQTAALTDATPLTIAMKSLEACKAEQRSPNIILRGTSLEEDQAAIKRVVTFVRRLR